MLKRLACLLLVAAVALSQAQERVRDLIYMKSGGAAFTMDVFKPQTPSGIGVIWLVSGGWFSSHQAIDVNLAKAFNDQGITVFEVVHGSQPKYQIPEILKQLRRAVRFVHVVAPGFGVDPHKIDVSGGSAGGHLSLMLAATGDDGNADSTDPIERAPSRVDAVAVFFPATDFLNFGGPGKVPLFTDSKYAMFIPAFGVTKETPADKLQQVGHDLSPIYFVTKQMPPTLLIHGDADTLVPIQQSQTLDAKLAELGVDHKLIVSPGTGHGAPTVTPANVMSMISWIIEKLGKK